MRGSGLLAFASFRDSRAPGGAANLWTNFENRLSQALKHAAAGGDTVWVNLVASTAGGTGAGMFLPVAWWLRQFAGTVIGGHTLNISLVAFWWTTFQNENIKGKERTELLTKGKSGSFAILRELCLLDYEGDLRDSTALPERSFPDWRFQSGPFLRYRLSGPPSISVSFVQSPIELAAEG